jgi:hypothetical protein
MNFRYTPSGGRRLDDFRGAAFTRKTAMPAGLHGGMGAHDRCGGDPRRHQPHFIGQPENVSVLWGYGLFVDKPGDFVKKPMSAARAAKS